MKGMDRLGRQEGDWLIKIQRFVSGITIDGHAGYAESGRDIVCAAVSILVWTLIKSLKDLTIDTIEYRTSDGHAELWFRGLSERGEFLVTSFLIGIEGVIKSYGEEYVKLI